MSAIAGYPEGRIIYVNYFSKNAPLADVRSRVVDMETPFKDDVHSSWTSIKDFELRLSSNIEYTYDEQSNVSEITGEALVFAGFIPKMADMFLYKLRNNKIGKFKITSIRRLAIGQDTYHQISFTAQEFLDWDGVEYLKRQTTDVFHFNKVKFTVGNHSMLTTDGYIELNELRHLRQEIIRNYMDRFYDTSYGSILRPDKIYDPYVVEYWNRKVGYNDCWKRPTQLLIAVSNYHKTIWSVLTDNPIKNLANVAHDWAVTTMHATFWSVGVTSLLEREFITVGDEAGSRYYPTVGRDGMPKLTDPAPFYPLIWDERIKHRADALMHSFAHWWYDGKFPHRKCPPASWKSVPENPYDPCDCEHCADKDHCGFHHHHHHHKPYQPHKPPRPPRPDQPERPEHKPPMRYAGPPYPILSNEELLTIWRQLYRIPEDKVLTDEDMARYRGYVLWYRESYPGTLSAQELEEDWRQRSGISPDRNLTVLEKRALDKYILSYREQHLPVLSDRELELMWRTHTGTPYDITIGPETLEDLHKFIINYRLSHGRVPPELVKEEPVLGSPITADEIDATDEDVPTDVPTPEPPIPEGEELPEVYHPKPIQHHICPKLCHYLCDHSPCFPDKNDSLDDTNYYALSKEFYLGSAAMTPFERCLYDLITGNEVRPKQVLELLANYLEWDNEDAFYWHLFGLFMIDRMVYWLIHHS